MKIITSTKEIDISDYGLKCLKYHITSPELINNTETVDGRDGVVFLDNTYSPRPITVEMFLESKDLIDLYLLQSDLNRLFAKKEPFYVIFKRESTKRWKVLLDKPFELEKIGLYNGSFNLELISFLPFAESIGKTLDPYTMTSNLWAVGMGLIAEDVEYIHNTGTFRIYNAGDVPIDPRTVPLNIKFVGASNNLTITNLTTGDEWKYNGTSNVGDVIEINGIRPFKNGTSILKSTNKKLISIDSGWNDFMITGVTGFFEISFDFRFYYL
ncbi:distal tail protein Dit [Heyndrickxia sp. FSL K6-6286]|uniref:distal tail protein Dit n=1 Tax=Heyndrickxia sp. FSL K6-6286 TaxID=2921510 RepID=UPI00315A951D